MGDESYMLEDGEDYLKDGCQRTTCDGCLAYDYCIERGKEKDNENRD